MSLLGQCPQLYDYYGVPSDAPVWFSCSGSNFTLVVATPNTVGNYSIDWGDGSPMHIGAAIAPPQTVSHPYAVAVATYTITFTELATGCVVTGTLTMEESTSASIQIPVGGLTQVCAPQAVQFTNSSTNTSPNTVFTWDFGDASPVQTMDHTNYGQTISHMYLPGTVSCETTVRLTAENTCNALQGGVSQATFNPIRVWDLDTAVISASATLLCWPDNEVTFVNNSLRNCLNQGNIFQRYEYWNFGDYWGVGQDSTKGWTPWPPAFPTTIAYPAIGTYEVVMLDSNVCGIDTARITINIVPPPTVTLSVTPDTVCAGETVAFTQTTNGGANYYQWNFGTGGGFNSTAQGNQSHTFNTPGTYTVRYAASIQGAPGGCADTASVQLVVLPSPTAVFTVDNIAACNSLTVTFVNTSTGAVQYLWDFGDGTTSGAILPPPHTYNVTGAYTITLTVTNALQCSDIASRIVHVYQPPNVQIGAQNVCEGETASFTDLTVTEPGNAVTGWQWDFGDGTTSTNAAPFHLYAASGAYTVTLMATTPYCSGTGTLPVSVEAKPTATFSPTSVVGCSPLTVSFTNSSIGASTAAWTFGDGVVSSNWDDSHTFVNTGTQDTAYTVRLIVGTGSGCSDTATAVITVGPVVHAQFVHNAAPGCAPLNVNFTNQSTGATSYNWSFGDGTTSTSVSPSHQYVNNTFFLQIRTITLVATSASGCTHTTTQQLMVYPTPDFTFSALPDSGCSPLAVSFPSVIGAVSYLWDFGDGTTSTNVSPVHTYVNNGTSDQQVQVTLIGSNAFGCTDTTYTTVNVYPGPVAQFSLSDTSGCHPFTATITNGSSGASSYAWSYGDGASSSTSSASHSHTWTNFGTTGVVDYPVSLSVTTGHGCTSSATQHVLVSRAVTASFVVDSSGCAPHIAEFINVSSGATSYHWLFGDGTTDSTAAPTHVYANQGINATTFNATLIASSSLGCSDSTTVQIAVDPQPIAQFTTNTQAGCQPLVVNFEDLSIGATNMHWEYGDGGALDTGPGNTTHTYVNTGSVPITFNASLIATTVNGCTDTTSTQIEVYPMVVSSFSVDSIVCSPYTTNISNYSTGANSYLWNMGDGTTMVGENPNYTYVNNNSVFNIRTITLTSTSIYGCTSVATHNVVIYSVPVASFQATPFVQQFPNATVNISNTSSPGPWTYAWTFGDGTSATTQSAPPRTYATWGTYMITLITGNGICSDTAFQEVVIQPPSPTASFIGSGEGCAPLTVAYTNASWNAQSYQWQFGDGGTSAADNPIYTFNVPGVYTVTMTAFGIGGASNMATKVDSVIVHPRAVAYFVLYPGEVIVPSGSVQMHNLSSNANDYTWQFGDGGTSTDMNPVYYYSTAGSYDVTLVSNNQFNCPDTFTVVGAVTAEVAGSLQFPNAFTPGTDGPSNGEYDPRSLDNRFFFPLYSGVEQYDLKIFDRWGELVFATGDIKVGWDGYYRGQPAKQDVYVWKAFAKFSDGRETVLKGDLTLLR